MSDFDEMIKTIIQDELVKYEDGKWYIYKKVCLSEKMKDLPDASLQWHNIYQGNSSKKIEWIRGLDIPEECVGKEWFQLKVIKSNASNIEHFKEISTDRVWQKLLEDDGKNIQYLKPQKKEYQEYAKKLNIENIQYFNPLYESDAKLLLSQPNFYLNAELDSWYICKGKKLCVIPLNEYVDKNFFYKKAFEYKPEIAANYIALLAVKKGEPSAINFVLNHSERNDFTRCIADLAKQGNNEAQKIVFEKPNLNVFLLSIIELAKQRNAWAREYVIAHSENELCLNAVADLAQMGDLDAIKIAESHLDNYKCWFFVVKQKDFNEISELEALFPNVDNNIHLAHTLILAKNNDEQAVKFVLSHYGLPKYWDFIIKLAKEQKNDDAREIILEHPERPECLECAALWATTDNDKDALNIVFKNASNPTCLHTIIELSNQGNNDATKYVLSHPDKLKCLRQIIRLADKKCDDAIKYVLTHPDNPDCLRQIITLARRGNNAAVQYVSTHPDNSDCLRQIISLSREGNNDAVKYVVAHPNNSDCLECIVYLAAVSGNKEADLIVQNNIDEEVCLRTIKRFLICGNKYAKKIADMHPEIAAKSSLHQSAEMIKPIDWAEAYGIRVDIVMQLLRNAGATVRTHMSKVDAAFYEKIEGQAVLEQQKELRKTDVPKKNFYDGTLKVALIRGLIRGKHPKKDGSIQ